MTRVLPEPAPARISRGPSVCRTASLCSGFSFERKFMEGEPNYTARRIWFGHCNAKQHEQKQQRQSRSIQSCRTRAPGGRHQPTGGKGGNGQADQRRNEGLQETDEATG